MSPPPSLYPITQSLLAALRTTGRPFGDLAAPPDPTMPYGFLTRLDPAWSGSAAGQFEQVQVTYQVTVVALDSAGVEWLEARVHDALDPVPPVPGWHLMYAEHNGGPGIRPDDDVDPPRYFSTPRWTLWAQPTA